MASTELIDAFRGIIVNKRLIEPFLESNPHISETDQAEVVTFQALRIVESALVAYDVTTRRLRADET